MSALDLQHEPHRRFNPLMQEWVLVSPHRTERPWQGQTEQVPSEPPPRFDPSCYMCPGNLRADGARNPEYGGTYIFENDFPALLPRASRKKYEERGLLVAEGEPGVCRVLCYSPRHDLTLSTLEPDAAEKVVDVWAEQYSELSKETAINYVQIFENRGAMMGASNPHPHCQIWANATLPNIPQREQFSQHEYNQRNDSCLLCAYLQLEAKHNERIVLQNGGFVVVVPFWAVWPFETLVLPRRHATNIANLNHSERTALADVLQRLTLRYDRLFETSFPYSMGFHQQPTDRSDHSGWHLHAHFYPPL